jgi:microcystin degradation protein MlrC
MKIFAATFATETNTWAVVPTGRVDFERYGVYRGDGSTRSTDGIGIFHAHLKKLASADGHSVIESLTAFAQPAGRTRRDVYEDYRDQILEDLKAALPVDAVVLVLHGAMVADGYDDCEGEVIERVRAIVGPNVPIGVELDLHCHFTEQMRRHADVIVCYKEYPHTDGLERLTEVYRLVTQQAQGRIRPVTAVFDCRMVGMWHTTREPMSSFVQRMKDCEGKDGVLSVSLGHGFPRGDVADCGAKLWVVTDNDPAKAETLARELGRAFWDLRDETYRPPLDVPRGMKHVLASKHDRPIVIADVGDNPGGGAMSDSTFLLQGMLDAGIGNAAIGLFWDLGAIALCQSAGVGATLDLRIGGKCGPTSGTPVDLRVTVRAIVENHGQTGLNARFPLGTGVWVQTANGIDIALASGRSQVLAPEAFEGLGIQLAGKKLIVVKSSQHFHATFAPIAAEVLYVDSPGSTAQNFAETPFTKRDLNYWPRVQDPW